MICFGFLCGFICCHCVLVPCDTAQSSLNLTASIPTKIYIATSAVEVLFNDVHVTCNPIRGIQFDDAHGWHQAISDFYVISIRNREHFTPPPKSAVCLNAGIFI